MKILHILDHSFPVLSGYSARSRNILVFQKTAGLQPVALTSPKHGPTSAEVEFMDGVPHYRIRATEGLLRTPSPAREIQMMLRIAARTLRVARDERAQLLHAHSPVLNGLPALWAGRRLAIPVVYEVRAFWEDAAVDHGTTHSNSLRYRIIRALETLVAGRASAVVTIGEAMRRELAARRVPAQRTLVVPNGVDTDWFRPIERSADLVDRFGLNGGPVLGFVGSFYRYEGLEFLVTAFRALRRRVPGLRLLLVGGGEQEAILQRGQSVNDGVILAGRVPHSIVRKFYALCDVFVCPRMRNRLTELVTPLKPLEAMAMALPVLASDVGGLAELVLPGETGMLFRAESQEAFVEQAATLATDPALRRRIGSRAREWVAAERTWARVVSRYTPLYRTLTLRGTP